MTAAVAIANLVLGVAYTCYGVITAMEMRRDWRSFGFSHFGAAWIAMAFTCGPHHLAHGIHVGLEGRPGGPLDLLAVVIGLPVGVVWLSLRLEAFFGGRGDRFILGEPRWLRAMPAASALYLAVLAAGASMRLDGAGQPVDGSLLSVLPNLLLVGIYMAIGWFTVRTQLRNHPLMGGWSVSGPSRHPRRADRLALGARRGLLPVGRPPAVPGFAAGLEPGPRRGRGAHLQRLHRRGGAPGAACSRRGATRVDITSRAVAITAT